MARKKGNPNNESYSLENGDKIFIKAKELELGVFIELEHPVLYYLGKDRKVYMIPENLAYKATPKRLKELEIHQDYLELLKKLQKEVLEKYPNGVSMLAIH